jgi:hypothetical protein
VILATHLATTAASVAFLYADVGMIDSQIGSGAMQRTGGIAIGLLMAVSYMCFAATLGQAFRLRLWKAILWISMSVILVAVQIAVAMRFVS